MGTISLGVGILIFLITCVWILTGIRNMSADYQRLENLDVSESTTATISYDDHFASEGFGIQTDPENPEMREELNRFIEESLKGIDEKIVVSVLVFTMVTVTVLVYWFYWTFGENRKKYIMSILLGTLILFGVFLICIVIAHTILHMPFYFPLGYDLLLIIASLLSIAAGSCFLGWLIRRARFKGIVAIAAIPAVIAFFVFGTVFEYGLFTTPQVDSFDYVVQDYVPNLYDENFEGEAYYDEVKNVMIVNGTEYSPRQADNPEYLRGVKRMGAILYEALNPYGGNGLFAAYEVESNINISVVALILYVAKALLFVLLTMGLKNSKS